MSEPVWIVTTGVRTPLGFNSFSSAAAVRAAISAVSQHPFMVDQLGNAITSAADPELACSLQGPTRMLAMAAGAWHELVASVQALQISKLSVPLYMALPELRPGFTMQDGEFIRQGLKRFAEASIETSEVLVRCQGHAAGLAAIDKACELIRQREVDACVVGGVDSYMHPDTIEWLDGNRQLAGEASRGGFVPGEGAGFCLLMSDALCRRLGVARNVEIASSATGRETQLIKTQDLCLGLGLTAVVQKVVEGEHSADPIDGIICDVNGERYRGEEWGFVCLRLGRHFRDPTDYLSPADIWGDMGAASGPLFAMLAYQAALRGYAPGPRTLLWASSEGGLRTAVIVASHTIPTVEYQPL